MLKIIMLSLQQTAIINTMLMFTCSVQAREVYCQMCCQWNVVFQSPAVLRGQNPGSVLCSSVLRGPATLCTAVDELSALLSRHPCTHTMAVSEY